MALQDTAQPGDLRCRSVCGASGAPATPRWKALLACVNFGRDCDCRAYIAGGLSATLNGSATLPREWIDTIEQELPTDPYTVSRRSLADTAEGLYRAALHTLAERKRQVELVETLLAG